MQGWHKFTLAVRIIRPLNPLHSARALLAYARESRPRVQDSLDCKLTFLLLILLYLLSLPWVRVLWSSWLHPSVHVFIKGRSVLLYVHVSYQLGGSVVIGIILTYCSNIMVEFRVKPVGCKIRFELSLKGWIDQQSALRIWLLSMITLLWILLTRSTEMSYCFY